MYRNGDGVPQDYAEAINGYRMAAKQGHAAAQRYLGVMYYYGDGVPQNYEQAEKWTRLAAEQGYAPAQKESRHIVHKGRRRSTRRHRSC